MLTVIEADPEGDSITGNNYHRKITVKQPIAGRKGKRSFRRNNFIGTCSILEPLPGVVESFGMENYCQLIERIEFDCDTIPGVLEAQKISSLDFLKTDIEGLDFEIIQNCEKFLGKTHFIQCELRFRPFYETEPYFHEVANFLAGHGYEILDIIHIDRWKYKTPRRRFQVQGRAQWADFLFVLKPEILKKNFGEQLPEAVAKQIILACALGKKNYGEYLLHQFKTEMPAEWFAPLESLTHPRFPATHALLTSLRRFFRPAEIFLKHQIGKSKFVAIR
jgi:hypothetical protein